MRFVHLCSAYLFGLRCNFHRLAVLAELDREPALLDHRTVRGRGEECGDARSARSHFLGERSLRCENDLELAAEILPLELLVLAHVRRDHALDLASLEEDPQADIIDAAIVGHHGQILDARVANAVNERRGDAAESETADQQRGAVLHLGLSERGLEIGANLGRLRRGETASATRELRRRAKESGAKHVEVSPQEIGTTSAGSRGGGHGSRQRGAGGPGRKS